MKFSTLCAGLSVLGAVATFVCGNGWPVPGMRAEPPSAAVPTEWPRVDGGSEGAAQRGLSEAIEQATGSPLTVAAPPQLVAPPADGRVPMVVLTSRAPLATGVASPSGVANTHYIAVDERGTILPAQFIQPLVLAQAATADTDAAARAVPPQAPTLSGIKISDDGQNDRAIREAPALENGKRAELQITYNHTEAAEDALIIQLGTLEIRRKRADNDLAIDLSLIAGRGEQAIRVSVESTGGRSRPSDTKIVNIDHEPPRLARATLVGDPGKDGTIVAQFDKSDLRTDNIVKAMFHLQMQDGPRWITNDTPLKDPVPSQREVHFGVDPLPVGNYRLVVLGAIAAQGDLANQPTDQPLTTSPALSDLGGNEVPYAQALTFSALPGPEPAPHVEFPRYIPPKAADEDNLAFNPGAHVETRVARLYYYRDAHHVAEIINRNVKSYNLAAVTQAQQTAEALRDSANSLTDERRQKERTAIRAAEATRQAEAELRAAEQELEQARAAFAKLPEELAAIEQRLKEIGDEMTGLIGAAKQERDKLDSSRKQAGEDFGKIETNRNEKDSERQALIVARQKLDASKLAKSRELNRLNRPPEPANDLEATNRQRQIEALEDEIDGLEQQILDQNAKIAPLDIDIMDLDRQRAELQSEIDDLSRQIARLDAQISNLEQEKSVLQKRQEQLGVASGSNKTSIHLRAVEEASEKVKAYRDKVGTSREAERNAGEESLQAEGREDRAKEHQWRAEVAAQTADPNTYAPAKKDSIDPVTQVSISVIGEGLIQLRGPIEGINTIRTMINQIDSPVGQVKVGIDTIQINGEHGDRMEGVAARIEANIDVSRFLTSQSLMLLRRAIQEVAGAYATAVDNESFGHSQEDRDRKYVYTFFGRDFIDELYAMDSEFLHTENKLLSLHSIDTISLSKALFIMSLAKNDVRQQILERFIYLVQCELPQAEYDFRMTNQRSFQNSRWCRNRKPKIEDIAKRACEQYTFRSVRGYFDAQVGSNDVMTPTQREFIRLAQIFKSQLVAEMELKQRIVERGLVQDRVGEDQERANLLKTARTRALTEEQALLEKLVAAENASSSAQALLAVALASATETKYLADRALGLAQQLVQPTTQIDTSTLKTFVELNQQLEKASRTFDAIDTLDNGAFAANIEELSDRMKKLRTLESMGSATDEAIYGVIGKADDTYNYIGLMIPTINDVSSRATNIADRLHAIQHLPSGNLQSLHQRSCELERLNADIIKLITAQDIREAAAAAALTARSAESAFIGLQNSQALVDRTRSPLNYKKLLDFLIDEQHEKYIELVEATRSHIAAVDGHIKRLYIALEDDFKVQYYDPAFAEIRKASWEWDVTLGQVEKTTILTNNRQFAKVTPEATMEFDLPKRDIMITEAMNGARALVNEYGTLLQDPTFLSLTGMLSGSPAVGGVPAGNAIPGVPGQGLGAPGVKSVLPGLPSDNLEQVMASSGGPERRFGAALEALIPDPSVYKFETGTGFEIRPVIQPDGDSVVYDFDYMYSTNVREPVRPDEKHLGRVKRHFVHTQVQTGSFELREVSRYQVALKASRTSRGLPLFEDIPAVGALFRPLPSDESSLQQNIILAESTVYPTLFDLMGLRWAPSAVDLDHRGLRDSEFVVRGRRKNVTDFVFDYSSDNVDDFLDIPESDRRRDLYHRQYLPSPYHPGGYVEDNPLPTDPTRSNFEIRDPRPDDMREPMYDRFHRNEELPVPVLPGIPFSTPEVPPGQPYQGPGSTSTRTNDKQFPDRLGVNTHVDSAPAVKLLSFDRVNEKKPAKLTTPVDNGSPKQAIDAVTKERDRNWRRWAPWSRAPKSE